MRKYKFNIPPCADERLDKIRFYLARIDNSADLFKDEHIVYDGDYTAEVAVSEYTQGCNYYCVEYYGDGVTPQRSKFVKSKYMIDDVGPWNILPESRRYRSADHRWAHMASLGTDYPEYARWTSEFVDIVEGHFTTIGYTDQFTRNNVHHECTSILSADGTLRLYPATHGNRTIGGNQVRRMLVMQARMPKESLRHEVGGYIWEIELPNKANCEAIYEYSSTIRTAGSNYAYSKNPSTLNASVADNLNFSSYPLHYMSEEDYELFRLCETDQEALDLAANSKLYYASSAASRTWEPNYTEIAGIHNTSFTPNVCLRYIGLA